MGSAQLALILSLGMCGQEHTHQGVITGVVVNATQGGVPSPRADVVLRVRVDGAFVPVAGTTTDEQGRFRFSELPVGGDHVYLPGANCAEVHYPGVRLQLTVARPHAAVRLAVCDTVAHPSPLVIKRQEILIKPEPGVLRVTESLLIDNPTSATYVGQAAVEGAEPVTLMLGIPSDFERTTFHREFFGRNFSIAGDKVVTSIPWTPGQRDVTFTYTLPNQARCRLWERPLDLPCEHLRLRVEQSDPTEVNCSLGRAAESLAGEIIFEARGTVLPAGHVLRVQLGRLPLPWTLYAKWGTLMLLVVLAGLTLILARQNKRRAASSSPRHAARTVSQSPFVRREDASRRAWRRRAA